MTSKKTIKHYPLSSPQLDFWFDQILHPNVPLYNIGGYVRIDGSINPALFEKALNQVIEENDALRIILHEGESLPTQTFAENVQLKLDFFLVSRFQILFGKRSERRVTAIKLRNIPRLNLMALERRVGRVKRNPPQPFNIN